MRILFLFIGILSLVLGVIGIFLPVLPTTPFLLLSATLFLRSSQKLYDWLLSHPYLGEYIRNFKEYKAIPLRVKVVSVSLVWITLLYCALFVAREWWMSAMFIAIAFGPVSPILFVLCFVQELLRRLPVFRKMVLLMKLPLTKPPAVPQLTSG